MKNPITAVFLYRWYFARRLALFCQRLRKLPAEIFGFLQLFFRRDKNGAEALFEYVGFQPFQTRDQVGNSLAAPAVRTEYQHRAFAVVDGVYMA